MPAKKAVAKTAAAPAKKAVAATDTAPKAVKAEKRKGIKVGDPQELRPKDLPLVVEPESGKWENEAQEAFAKILNAYAYRNPAKWESKKETLLDQLEELATNPGKFGLFSGSAAGAANLNYKNHLIEK